MTIFLQFFRQMLKRGRQVVRSDLWPILSITVVLVVAGTFAIALIEQWSLLEGLYFIIITMTTIGYGDYSPQTTGGRIFIIFFALIAIGIAGYAISTLAAYTIQAQQRKVATKLRKRRMKRIELLNQHFILCGSDLLGLRIAEEFSLAQVPYVIIDNDEERLKRALLFTHPDYFRNKIRNLVQLDEFDVSIYEDRSLSEISEMVGVAYILDDPTDDVVLLRAGIGRAQGLIAALPDDRDNLAVVIGARGLANRENNVSLRIMSRSGDSRYIAKLYLAGADSVRNPSLMGGLEMASHMIYPELGNWWYKNRGLSTERTPHPFRQVSLAEQPLWIGQTIGQVHADHGVMILAVKRNETFFSPPAHNLPLLRDDLLIVLSEAVVS